MTAKKKADQQASPKKTQLDDTSSGAQRARLLAHLRQHGSINTFEAIRQLNIVRPAARIKELRQAGHEVKTHRISLTDDHGRPHHGIALYYLGTLPASLAQEAA